MPTFVRSSQHVRPPHCTHTTDDRHFDLVQFVISHCYVLRLRFHIPVYGCDTQKSVCLWLFYALATSKIISGQHTKEGASICDAAGGSIHLS